MKKKDLLLLLQPKLLAIYYQSFLTIPYSIFSYNVLKNYLIFPVSFLTYVIGFNLIPIILILFGGILSDCLTGKIKLAWKLNQLNTSEKLFFQSVEKINNWTLVKIINDYNKSKQKLEVYRIKFQENELLQSETLNKFKAIKLEWKLNCWQRTKSLFLGEGWSNPSLVFYVNVSLLSEEVNWLNLCWSAARTYLNSVNFPKNPLLLIRHSLEDTLIVLNSYPTKHIKFVKGGKKYSLDINLIEWVFENNGKYYLSLNGLEQKRLIITREEIINAHSELCLTYRNHFALKLIEELVKICHGLSTNSFYHSFGWKLHYWTYIRLKNTSLHN